MIFYTADTHFGEEGILKAFHRPFASAAEMDKAMISRWNSVVGEDDTVFHLGDLGVGFPEARQKLNGRIVLVAGNHDLEGRGIDRFPDLAETYAMPIILGNKILSHEPLIEGIKEQEYYLNLHGHIHDNQAREDLNWWRGNRWYNVGADVNNFTPVSNYDIQFFIKRFSLVPES